MTIPKNSMPANASGSANEPSASLLAFEDLSDCAAEQLEVSLTLNLLQNSLDSLNEGLTQYRAFSGGRLRASKFAVLHFSHYLELLLKHCVAELDEDAIWTSATKTIGAHESLEFLKNQGVDIPETFETEFRWFKKLRNNVEHFEFTLNGDQVRQSVGRLLHDADLIRNACRVPIDFPAALEGSNIEVFAELSKEYAARLQVALQKVHEAERTAYRGVRPKFQDMVNFYVGDCDNCGQKTFITSVSSPTGFQCEFCGEQHADGMPMDCSLCGMPWTRGDLTFYKDWTGEGESAYACPRCLHHPDYVTND